MRISPGKLDLVLIVPLIAALMMIGDEPREQSVAMTISPWMQAGGLGIVTAILVLFVAKASSLDRRCGEEYVFHVMANAAFVALGTMALLNMAWLITAKFYPLHELTGQNMAGVTILAWILGYYWYRMRGLQQ